MLCAGTKLVYFAACCSIKSLLILPSCLFVYMLHMIVKITDCVFCEVGTEFWKNTVWNSCPVVLLPVYFSPCFFLFIYIYIYIYIHTYIVITLIQICTYWFVVLLISVYHCVSMFCVLMCYSCFVIWSLCGCSVGTYICTSVIASWWMSRGCSGSTWLISSCYVYFFILCFCFCIFVLAL